MNNTPFVQPSRESETRSVSHAWSDHPPKAILIVEDETSIRRLLVSLLSAEGYRIESVADGTLALRILEDDPEIDLVLTDLAMPGIPGTAVAEFIAQARPEVKVVCMSGNPHPHEKSLRRLLERSLVDFLPKPFTPGQVLQMVKRLLDR
jgi:two-component system, cell cycle sensor histidine kinase and response regulator CckA